MAGRKDSRHDDKSRFPDPTYTETVLRPLFEGMKAHHVEGLDRINRAHLAMLAETGILDRASAGRLAGALVAIGEEVEPATLTYTGEVEDYFFFVEAELKRRLGPDLAGRLHTARSRNDIDHTLFRLALKRRIDDLLARLDALLETLLDAAEREKETPIVAYTHGQPAQPTSFGHYLAAIAETLIRDIERVEAARRVVDRCPMGAAAITTSGFPVDRRLMARLLGFAEAVENSYGAIAAVDYVTATYSALELVALHLGRPIQDLQFWSSFEVGQIYVPNAFVQISSIMPQKRNPVPIEHLRHLMSQTAGRARAVLGIVHNTPFTDMNDSEGETQEFGYEAFATAFRALDLMTALLGAIRIDPARVARNISRSAITITELADSLVRLEGLSFRQSHGIAAEVARSVVAAGGDLARDGYAPFAAAFRQATGRDSAIDAARFAELVSPEHFIAIRERFGGPGRKALEASIAGYRQALAGFRRQADGRSAREAEAKGELDRRFNTLIGGG